MKILWISHDPFSVSSFSVLSRRTLPDLVADGHEVTALSYWSIPNQPQEFTFERDGHKLGTIQTITLPMTKGADKDRPGSVRLYPEFMAVDCIITCEDIVKTETVGNVPQPPLVGWLPVHVGPPDSEFSSSIEGYQKIYSMSKWGVDVLARSGIKSGYLPCSVPGDIFRPGDKRQTRAHLRQATGCPVRDDSFLVVMVGTNHSKIDHKGLVNGLLAFAEFYQQHQNSYLYIHTDLYGAIDLRKLIERLPIPQKSVLGPPGFHYSASMLPEQYLADIYRAADVYLTPSKVEGFCLPLVEAQMCGIPAIGTDCTSIPENLFSGWLVKGNPTWFTDPDGIVTVPIHSELVAALEESYRERDNEALQRQAAEQAARFDSSRVFAEYWRPALVDIERLVERRRSQARPAVVERPAPEHRKRRLRNAKRQPAEQPVGGVG